MKGGCGSLNCGVTCDVPTHVPARVPLDERLHALRALPVHHPPEVVVVVGGSLPAGEVAVV